MWLARVDDHQDRQVGERHEKAGGKMDTEAHEEAGPLSQEKPAEPDDQRRERRPGVPVGKRPGKGLRPRAAAAENAGVDELDWAPKRSASAVQQPRMSQKRVLRGGAIRFP